MRYEWSPLIRNRRWLELEAIAKREPSQQLSDTLNELLKGIEEPAERKILKRALHLAKVAGFSPSPENPFTVEQEFPRLPKIGTLGTLHSPDAHGFTPFTFGIVKGSVLHAGMCISGFRYGSVRVDLIQHPANAVPLYLKGIFDGDPCPIGGEVDPAYTLHRFKRAWENRRKDRTQGKLNAFWRQLFTHVPTEFPHPAASYGPSEDIGPDGRRRLMNESPCSKWRIFLPPDDDLWERIHAIRWDEALSPLVKRTMFRELLMNDRVRLCTVDEIEDFWWRLMDCALILGPENQLAAELVHAANHLKENWWHSDVFEELLYRTADELDQEAGYDEFEVTTFPKNDLFGK